ncbi:MAG: sigma-70 family RNA polymerase sigma factor [Oscillospiraceae bacterium]|nr:sigma-70 family RNA polymerase sigma factor [Oscillospiraceae bacterium]
MIKHRKTNRDTFTEQFRQQEADLYRMAYVYVKNEQDALDVMQEAAYRAYKNYHALQNPQYFKTWVTRIVINCAIDCIRKNKEVLPLEDYAENLPVLSHSEEQQIILSATLQQLMDILSPQEKSVILLKYYEQYTFREISQILGLPEGTVKSLLYRALHKLRTAAKEEL